jgi:serine protease
MLFDGTVATPLDDSLLHDLARQQQQQQQIILETRKDGASLSELKELLYEMLPGIEFSIENFFESRAGSLSRFFLLKIPSTSIHKIPGGPFELSHQLYHKLSLASCDPIVETEEETTPRRDQNFQRSVSGARMDCAGSNDNLEWHLEKAGVLEAWKYSAEQGKPVAGEGIVVAQPDTGIRQMHPALEGVNYQLGFNVRENEDPRNATDPFPECEWPRPVLCNPGHGTSTGALVTSLGKRGTKVRGSANNCEWMPIRTVNRVALFPDDLAHLAKAIEGAMNQNAHVISMSLASFKWWSPSALSEVILKAVKNDIIVVAAAGNNVGFVGYPASDENVIAVAGTDRNDKPWKESCRGREVDVSAPAHEICVPYVETSSDPPDQVGLASGTSFSAALTAGIAANWLAHHGRDSLIAEFRQTNVSLHEAFRACMKHPSSYDRPPNWDVKNFGVGIVDAAKILKLPLSTITIPKGRAVPQRHALTSSDLARMGADKEYVSLLHGSLSDSDLQHFSNELLWLGRRRWHMKMISKLVSFKLGRRDDSFDFHEGMSPFLRDRLVAAKARSKIGGVPDL